MSMKTERPIQTSYSNERVKEAYFTASQGQLIWARFKKQRAAMIAAIVLVVLILSGIFAPFLSPYDPTTGCLLYTSPSPRDRQKSRMPSSA